MTKTAFSGQRISALCSALFGACFALSLSACASAPGDSGTRMGSDPDGGAALQLQAGAYGNEYFSVSKPMKIRPPNDYVYYFKHCNLLGRRPFYLQNEYGCTPPP